MGSMPSYRIFLLDEARIPDFRDRAPKPGAAVLKPTHYEETLAVEADHPYDAWKQLQGEEAAAAGLPRAMGVGDVLADEQNALLLLNYWGFDPAAWFDPEASKNPFAREGAPEVAEESTRETAEQVV